MITCFQIHIVYFFILGYLEAHVSWSCPQTRSEMLVAGYKVLIDGKQYGSAMHEGVKTVRIKVSKFFMVDYRCLISQIYNYII